MLVCRGVEYASEDGSHAKLRLAPAQAAMRPGCRPSPSSRPAAAAGLGLKGSRACRPATSIVASSPNMYRALPTCMRVTIVPPGPLQPASAATIAQRSHLPALLLPAGAEKATGTSLDGSHAGTCRL